MLETALAKEREEWKQEWKKEWKQEIARKMLTRGMEVSVISEFTNLAEEVILQLKNDTTQH